MRHNEMSESVVDEVSARSRHRTIPARVAPVVGRTLRHGRRGQSSSVAGPSNGRSASAAPAMVGEREVAREPRRSISYDDRDDRESRRGETRPELAVAARRRRNRIPFRPARPARLPAPAPIRTASPGLRGDPARALRLAEASGWACRFLRAAHVRVSGHTVLVQDEPHVRRRVEDREANDRRLPPRTPRRPSGAASAR